MHGAVIRGWGSVEPLLWVLPRGMNSSKKSVSLRCSDLQAVPEDPENAHILTFRNQATGSPIHRPGYPAANRKPGQDGSSLIDANRRVSEDRC